MYEISTLKNGLTLITVSIPSLDSVTTLLSVGAGSRFETKKINGISHFLEHMFFKGSRKYPTTEIISSLVDGIGAINNAATSKEYTFYWVKSAAKHLELSSDIISSMLSEPLFQEEEIEREKGVIVEEIRMYKDNPQAYIGDLYESLQFGDQPLGWEIAGSEKVINSIQRADFLNYIQSLYSPKNMALVYAGKIPKNIKQIAQKYFNNLPNYSSKKPLAFKRKVQTKPKIGIHYKKIDQANLILGVEGFDRVDPKRYAARVLGAILGESMSSRLFIQVRERRGLAYRVSAGADYYLDTGIFAVYAGLKLERVYEGLEVIVAELLKLVTEKVADVELKKAKEMIRGRLAIRSESTNFLAEHFGTEFILDRQLETFDDYLNKIDKVTAEEIQKIAQQLFVRNRFNLQVIGPFKDKTKFTKILTG